MAGAPGEGGLKWHKVHVHDESFSSEELLLQPEMFPEISDGDVVALDFAKDESEAEETSCQPGLQRQQSLCADEDQKLVLRAKFVGKEGASKRIVISLLKRVAEARGSSPWTSATVKLVKSPETEAAAEFVEFSFKDQFISRADIWRFKSDVFGETAYVGKTFLSLGGMRATARVVLGKNGRKIASGFLVDRTRFIFRSRSTRIFWLVQMSSEMWEPTGDYDDQGSGLYVERFVEGFAAPLLARWKDLDVNHSLSVVLFTRLERSRPNADGLLFPSGHKNNACQTTWPDDLYRVALENEQAAKINEVALVAKLKRELVAFARSLATRLRPQATTTTTTGGKHKKISRPTPRPQRPYSRRPRTVTSRGDLRARTASRRSSWRRPPTATSSRPSISLSTSSASTTWTGTSSARATPSSS